MSDEGHTGILLCPPLAPVELTRWGPNLIGRSPDCRFPVSNADASRRHTAVEWRDSAFVVRDLGSTNGTFVNGERVDGERVLRQGDRIEIGSTVITFCLVEGDLQQLLRGPGAAVTLVRNPAGEQQVFEGNIEEIPIFAVLQILEAGRKSGCLCLDGPEGAAELWLENGDPVDAKTDAAAGLEAGLALVARTSGRFAFEVKTGAPERTIELSMTQLLLEGSRAIDEQQDGPA